MQKEEICSLRDESVARCCFSSSSVTQEVGHHFPRHFQKISWRKKGGRGGLVFVVLFRHTQSPSVGSDSQHFAGLLKNGDSSWFFDMTWVLCGSNRTLFRLEVGNLEQFQNIPSLICIIYCLFELSDLSVCLVHHWPWKRLCFQVEI